MPHTEIEFFIHPGESFTVCADQHEGLPLLSPYLSFGPRPTTVTIHLNCDDNLRRVRDEIDRYLALLPTGTDEPIIGAPIESVQHVAKNELAPDDLPLF
jgi:hypothetical protein